MQTLNIDIETFSSIDIKSSGAYRYTEAPDFKILLIAHAMDSSDISIIDLEKTENNPYEWEVQFINMLTDPSIRKTAHNAAFERTCLAKYFDITLDPDQWECTMVRSSMVGLPLSLDAVAKALHLEEQKDSTGKALIRFFCTPCKPSIANGQRTRNLPEHAPEKWEEFKRYCIQDVRVERAIRDKINWFEIPAGEKELWNLDQLINDRGIMLDRQFVHNAISIDYHYRERITSEAISLTGLNNPNSIGQLKRWLEEEMPFETIDTLRKGDIPVLLKNCAAYKNKELLEKVLGIRQEMSKTSVKKYTSMSCYIGNDGRARGLFQFNGANRTGRWAGRGIQMQNLPRINFENSCLDYARKLVKTNEDEELEMMFGNVPDTLSQLIRTAFIATPGHKFVVADFSAIEARVIAWLAGEQWRLDVFNTHGKIYEASAAQMFKVPIETIVKGHVNYLLRQKGKIAELALGYQGGPNALITMGALEKGLKEHELQPLVNAWRSANPAIVQCWADVNEAAINAVDTGQVCGVGHSVSFYVKRGVLFMQLPSGRCLAYTRPKLKPGKFGGQALTYEGIIQTNNQWGRMDTYGGKLVENAVQAIARDCLAHAMLAVHKAGYKIVAHVHDEIIMEVPEGFGSLYSLEDACAKMSKEIPWAKGLPLDADGFEGKYYKK